MKAIIIEEERFVEITELMKLKALQLKTKSNTPGREGIPQHVWDAAIDEVHRNMNYHFVSWAQSQGASCVKY